MPHSLNVSNMQSFYQQHQEIDAAGSPHLANALAEYLNSWSQETDPTENGSPDQEINRMSQGHGSTSASSTTAPPQYGHMHVPHSAAPGSSQSASLSHYHFSGGPHTSGQIDGSTQGAGQFTFRLPSQPANGRIYVGLLPPATISKGPVASKRTKHRAVRACNRCRQGKQKCNGEHPCIKCITRGHVCMYDERPLKKSGLPVASKNRVQTGSSVTPDAGKRKLDATCPSPSSSRACKVAKEEPESCVQQNSVYPRNQWSTSGPWGTSSQGSSTFTSDYNPGSSLDTIHTTSSALPPVSAPMTRSATQVPSGFSSCASAASFSSARQHPYSMRLAEAKPSSLKVVVAHGTGTSLVSPGFHPGTAFGPSSALTGSAEQQQVRSHLPHEWWNHPASRPDQAQTAFGFVAVTQPHHFDSISPLSTPVADTPTSDYHSAMSASHSYSTVHAHAAVSIQSQQAQSNVGPNHQFQQQQYPHHPQLYASTAATHNGVFAIPPPTRCISAPISMHNSSMFQLVPEAAPMTPSALSHNSCGAPSDHQLAAQGPVHPAATWQRGPSSSLYKMCQKIDPASSSLDSVTATASQSTDAPSPFRTDVESTQSSLPSSGQQKYSEGIGNSNSQERAFTQQTRVDAAPDSRPEADMHNGQADHRRHRADVDVEDHSTNGGQATRTSNIDVRGIKDDDSDALTDADAPGSPVDVDVEQ